MKKHLERKVKAGKSKPKLKDIDADILPAAWSILRWSAPFPSCRPHPAHCIFNRCVASCTAHIEAIDSGEELIKNLGETIFFLYRIHKYVSLYRLDPNWRQFRMTVGAPDAEAKFMGAVKVAMEEDSNARHYPVIYVHTPVTLLRIVVDWH